MDEILFISYRRGEDQATAGRLFDRLEKVFGHERIFIDVDSILPGKDFFEELSARVSECDIFLAVIGKRWADLRDDEGRRRIDDPKDWVRIEIETALSHGKHVIPILVDGAEMPSPEQLPQSLAPLCRRHAVRLTYERFRADVQGLADAIGKLRAEARKRREPVRHNWPSLKIVGVTALVVLLMGFAVIVIQTYGTSSSDGSKELPPPNQAVRVPQISAEEAVASLSAADSSTDFESDAVNIARTQLARALGDQVTSMCQNIIANRYPFARSDREVSLVDFGKLFGPQGVLDTFFKSQLVQYVDMSGRDWSFRQDSALGRALSSSIGTLNEFQRGAEIRETFFATGGLVPSVALTIVPPPLPVSAANAAHRQRATAPSTTIKMEINGATIDSKANPAAPVRVEWPGAATNYAAVTVTSEGQEPATIERSGPWALFRLVEAGAPVPKGDKIVVNYIVGGRTLGYTIGTGSELNPFTLPALREFRCPSGL